MDLVVLYSQLLSEGTYLKVQLLWLNFIIVSNVHFPLYLGMVMNDDEFETREDRI